MYNNLDYKEEKVKNRKTKIKKMRKGRKKVKEKMRRKDTKNTPGRPDPRNIVYLNIITWQPMVILIEFK